MKLKLLMAVTADGMIARNAMQLVDWTGREDKQYFVQVTRQTGVMIMGSKTFDTIGRHLPGRLNIVMTRNKDRKSKEENLIFTDQAPALILQDLESRGFTSAALIGGAAINSLFMEQGLIDEVHLTLVPKLFGKGLALFNNPLDIDLELKTVQEIGQGHVLMVFTVIHTPKE